jgi:hemolysin D
MSASIHRFPAKTAASAFEIVQQFHSESDALSEAPAPRLARATVFALGGLILSAIVLIFFTQMDRVVNSVGGKMVSTELVNVVQALDPSIIKSIDIREGDEVGPNQLLATLDPTFAAADVLQLKQQIASLEPQIARDTAQLEGRPLVFPKWSDPDLLRYAAIQRVYYDQQVAQYKAQLSSFDAKIRQTQAAIEKYRADEARYRSRGEVARKTEEMRTTLAERGADSRLNMYLAQDQRLEMVRALEYDHNSLIEAEHTLASLNADREAFIQQWSAQLSQDLVTSGNNLDAAKAQLEKATKHQDLVRVTATDQSIVLSIAKLSVGSVLKEGDTLFKLMPVNTPVEAEIHVSSRDIGFPRPGDRCVLKVDAFNYMEHGTAEGTVRWISENAFTTDDNDAPVGAYYKVRCGVDAMHFRNVPAKFRLIPGMTLNADVHVGTRSVAMYLLSGLMRSFNEAMREP